MIEFIILFWWNPSVQVKSSADGTLFIESQNDNDLCNS